MSESVHTQFILADKSTFYVGSANLDWRALTQIKELGVVVENCPVIGHELDKVFQVSITE